MRRRTFDIIMIASGLVLTIVLVASGGLLMWGYNFANDSVHDQLVTQKIFFPKKGSEALDSPEVGPYLNKYAGQQLVTGEQAEVYADHFIAVHLREVADGKTYSEVSAAAQADPDNAQLQAQVQTLFRGEALRGLLLNAYAFWKIAQIARWAAIASFTLGGLMLILSIVGMRHLGRVAPEAELLGGRHKEPEHAAT